LAIVRLIAIAALAALALGLIFEFAGLSRIVDGAAALFALATWVVPPAIVAWRWNHWPKFSLASVGLWISILAIAAWLIIASPTPARAQSAEAEVLFREGKRLMKEGKLAEACDKLEASDRLESSIGTLLNLADCREKNKQLVSAWLAFHKAVGSIRWLRARLCATTRAFFMVLTACPIPPAWSIWIWVRII